MANAEPTIMQVNDITVPTDAVKTIFNPCNAPAPIAVNGGGYVGCTIAAGHEGNHKTILTW